MHIYNTKLGPVVQVDNDWFLLPEYTFDELINLDNVLQVCRQLTLPENKIQQPSNFFKPMGESQEIWACGVTYLKSKIGREEESQTSGGADFYSKVYEADRPEVFFKSTYYRTRGHEEAVNIREDSTWDVPEPELILVVTKSGKIIGYTIGNDMSSRSIEGQNPLYLPQAKTYDGCAAIGPGIWLTEKELSPETKISMSVFRAGIKVFSGEIAIGQMKRKVNELVSFVYRACSFPHGCLIMTGTGIVPDSDFSLRPGDKIDISIDGIGTLSNTVQ